MTTVTCVTGGIGQLNLAFRDQSDNGTRRARSA